MLEGHEDIVTPLAADRERFYTKQECIRCGSSALKRIGDANTMFRGRDPLPRYTLRCLSCECEFDPHSNILLKMGNLGKAHEPSIPILKGPED